MQKVRDFNISKQLHFFYQLKEKTLCFRNRLTLKEVEKVKKSLWDELKNYPYKSLSIDLNELQKLDSVGVVFIQYINRLMNQKNIDVRIINSSPGIQNMLTTFSASDIISEKKSVKHNIFEKTGEKVYYFFTSIFRDFFLLSVDLFFWTFLDIFYHRARRKGEFINQVELIGVNAVPIIALISFLIGAVLSLQSAVQLRQFGANIYITDLLVISMTREMGPLITAILIAGRSGSAIASEIGTMVVTEEVDALKTMALNPVRYIVIPKMHASIITMPFLTIFSVIMGISGGMLIAFIYLNLTPQMFYNRMTEVLFLRDIFIGIFKSLVFAWVIVLAGSFYGFRVTASAERVGKYTTSAVVASIFLVIFADSILGLIFY